jgi:hypothetical protein
MHCKKLREALDNITDPQLRQACEDMMTAVYRHWQRGGYQQDNMLPRHRNQPTNQPAHTTIRSEQ